MFDGLKAAEYDLLWSLGYALGIVIWPFMMHLLIDDISEAAGNFVGLVMSACLLIIGFILCGRELYGQADFASGRLALAFAIAGLCFLVWVLECIKHPSTHRELNC